MSAHTEQDVLDRWSSAPESKTWTPRELAAMVVVVLMEERVVPVTPKWMHDAAQALGLTIPEIRTQWEQRRPNQTDPWHSKGHRVRGEALPALQRRRPTPAPDPIGVPEPAVAPQPIVEPPAVAAPKPKRGYVERLDGELSRRRCARCQKFHPIEAFRLMGKGNGRTLRDSYCRSCRLEFQRSRTITRDFLGDLGALNVKVTADRQLVCGGCGDPIVKGADAVVHGHAFHPDCTPED